MVVLRSTTPCVAVSSFSRSDLLTVISIVPPLTSGTSDTRVAVDSVTAVPLPRTDHPKVSVCDLPEPARLDALSGAASRYFFDLLIYQKNINKTAVEAVVLENVEDLTKSF